jgi:hypothetical protein
MPWRFISDEVTIEQTDMSKGDSDICVEIVQLAVMCNQQDKVP